MPTKMSGVDMGPPVGKPVFSSRWMSLGYGAGIHITMRHNRTFGGCHASISEPVDHWFPVVLPPGSLGDWGEMSHAGIQ